MTHSVRQRATVMGLAAACALLHAARASGADCTWLPQTTATSWSDASNWTPPTTGGPDTPGISVLINTDINALATINLSNTGDAGDATKTVGRLHIGDANNTHAFTLAAGTGSGVLDFNGNGTSAELRQLATSEGVTITAPVILSSMLLVTNASASALTFNRATIALGANTLTVSGGSVNFGNSPISGSGYIVINSTGNVSFGDVSTATSAAWTGGITLNSGTLVQTGYGGGDSGVPGVWGRGLLTINGGRLAGGNNTGRPMLISGQVWNADWSFAGNKTVNLGVGPISLGTAPGLARTITSVGTYLLTIGGAISDGTTANSLTKAGIGPVLLTGANIYTGPTTVHGGTLQFGKQASLPADWTAERLAVAAGAVAAFSVGGTGEFTAGDLDVLLALGSDAGGFMSGAIAGVDTTSATSGFTYGSVITNPNGGANALAVSKLGANTLVLSGANAYTGGTMVNGGTLQLSGPGQVGTGPVSVISGTMDINNLTRTFGGTLTLGGGATPTLAIGPSGALTLGGDVVYVSSGNSPAAITGGTLKLGIPRTFTVNDGSATPDMTVSATIGDGNGVFDVTKMGAGSMLYTPDIAFAANQTMAINAGSMTLSGALTGSRNLTKTGAGTLLLTGASSFDGDTAVTGGTLSIAGGVGAVAVHPGATLIFTSTGVAPLIARGPSVTLRSAALSVTGNSTANSVDAVDGALIVAPADTAGGYSCSTVTVSPNSARNARLESGRFVRSDGGVVLFRGTSLGVNASASQTANSANILFGNAPIALIGGGGEAGTSTISILPGAIGGTSTSDNGSTFVTYTTANGIRPLNTASEYATSIASGSMTANNVRLTGSGTLATLSAPTTINALIIRPSGNSSVDGTGPLTVSSGQVHLNLGDVSSTMMINVPLDFGTVEGIFCTSFNRLIEIKGAISGSGGLTFCQAPSGFPAIYCSVRNGSGSTYTGKTVVLGRLEVNSTFLPYGSRTGDVYVHGLLRLNQGGYNGTINGLYGGGSVYYANSGISSLTVGDNDANGDFTGKIDGNSNLGLVKTGVGTQRLAGTCTHGRATTVNGGTLRIDGSFTASAVTVNTGATLAGCGSVSKATTAVTLNSGATLAPGDAGGNGTFTVSLGDVVFNSGAALRVKAGRTGANLLDVADRVVGSGTVQVAVTGSGGGRWKVMQATAIAPNFVSTTPGAILYKTNNDTELWVERASGGTTILLR